MAEDDIHAMYVLIMQFLQVLDDGYRWILAALIGIGVMEYGPLVIALPTDKSAASMIHGRVGKMSLLSITNRHLVVDSPIDQFVLEKGNVRELIPSHLKHRGILELERQSDCILLCRDRQTIILERLFWDDSSFNQFRAVIVLAIDEEGIGRQDVRIRLPVVKRQMLDRGYQTRRQGILDCLGLIVLISPPIQEEQPLFEIDTDSALPIEQASGL